MKIRRKPIVLDGWQWHNPSFPSFTGHPPDIAPFLDSGRIYEINNVWYIKTMEGDMLLKHGAWIMCGVAGEIYAVDPDVFPKIYEIVEE